MNWFFSHKLLVIILTISFKYIHVKSLWIGANENAKSKETHLRYRRFALFPEGSAFAVTFADSFLIWPIFFEGFQFSINYDLPMNESLLLTGSSGSSRALLKRQRRSELYNDLEILMNSNGFNGQECVHRTLCEAQKLTAKNSMIDALLHVLFDYSNEDISESEPKNHHAYKFASVNGIQGQDCKKIYDSCRFSLMDFQLDKFS